MDGRPSLVRRLLWTLVGTLTAVAIVLGAGGAWLINRIAESTADRLLGASARAIAETLAVEDGAITLDLPPFALGMLENNERDNVYYSVRRRSELVTGYPDLPFSVGQSQGLAETAFRYERYRGARVRIAVETRSLPRIDGPITVQVAETLDARRTLARRMLVGLAFLEAVLIGVAALLVWPAVRWGLQPVIQLRAQIDARSDGPADFMPLPIAGVPSEFLGLVVGFNDLLRRLERSVDGMRRFTADASHQMRTPLTILQTHLAVVRKHGADSSTGQASLADIQDATDRLQSLFTGLIALARSEDAPVARHDEIDLKQVIRQVEREHRATAEAAGVTLRISLGSAELRAPADPLLLAELLGNLVDNAIRYTGSGGDVEIALKHTHPASIVIQDDGPGIPAPDRDRVLERFYRLPRDHRLAGSGLGLPIAYAIARRLSARISLADGPGGRGLACIIELAGDAPVGVHRQVHD